MDVVNWIAPILILALLGYLVWRFGTRVVLTERDGDVITVRRFSLSPRLLALGGALIVTVALFLSVRIVPVGHSMVTFNVVTKQFGSQGEGVAFVPPLLVNYYIYDLRRLDYTMVSTKGEGKKPQQDESLWSPTKEGLQVGLDLTVWYRINSDAIVDVHRKIGPDYEEKVIRPAIRSIARHVISSYPIMDVYSERRKTIEEKVFSYLKGMLEQDGFIIEGVVLRDVQFTPDFAKSIEQKQIAQQDAERMKYVLEKENLEADRKEIEATGTARAIKIVSEELKQNPQYIGYLYVDKLSDNVQVIVSDQSTILNLKDLIR